MTSDVIPHMFPEPLEVHRVRMVVSAKDKSIARGFVTAPGEPVNAQMVIVDGRLAVQLSSKVMLVAQDIAKRLI